jgi:transcriptional regulator with XRE-family HTH domain
MTSAGRPEQRWITVLDGKRLRQLRRQRGLSQEKLADRAGISAATVARLERHPHPSCRGRTLARLAAALGEQPAAIISPCSASRADSET